MRKIFVSIIVLLAVSLFAAGESEPVRIGVAGPYTGDLASYGAPTARAAEIIAEAVNAEGGLLGRQIELIIEDEQCEPAQAANVAAKFVGDQVIAVIGHICSGATRAALDIYKNEGIPVISPSATNPALTDGDYPTFFRTIAPDNAQALTQVEFLQSQGINSIAILHDKGDYGKGLAEFAQGYALEAGIDVVLFEGVTPGALDYSAIVLKISGTDAEAILFGGYHPEASKIVSQMRTQSLDLLFVSGDGVKDQTFINVAKDDAEGVYATGPTDVSSVALSQEARDLYVAKYNEEPGPFFNEGYAAVLSLLGAIENANSTDAAVVMSALRENNYDTSIGSISFDDKGDVIGAGFAVYQVQNGTYVELMQ